MCRFTRKILRPVQVEALEKIRRINTPIINLVAPTGAGKSIIGTNAFQDDFYYVCYTKILQEQIKREFGFSVFYGKENYPCYIRPLLSARYCFNLKKCPRKYLCPYYRMISQIKKISYPCMNMHLFITLAYTNTLTKMKYVIFDEGDRFEDVVRSIFSLELREEVIKQYGIEFPEKKARMTRKIDFLRKLQVELSKKDNITPFESELLFRIECVLDLIDTLLEFTDDLDDVMIFKRTEDGKLEFKPVIIPAKILLKIWRKLEKKTLFMSATLPHPEIFTFFFRIPQKEITHIELGNVFPVENQPVFFVNLCDFREKNKNNFGEEIRKTAKYLEQEIFKKHAKEKILIHSVSYKIQKALYEELRFSERPVFIHEPKNVQEQLKKFLETPNGVFISPALMRGIDLPDDKCRVIVFIKPPFPSLEDSLTAKILYGYGEIGRKWYIAKTVYEIIQGMGRGIRHKDDFCYVYLLDKSFSRVLYEYPNLLPKWFRERLYQCV